MKEADELHKIKFTSSKQRRCLVRRFVAVFLVIGGLSLVAQQSHFSPAGTDGPDDYLAADSTFNQFVRDMVVGSDLDMDGYPEIIISDYKDGGRIHVFEVTGNNTLQEVWTFTGGTGNPTSQPARSVTVGDLDGDGRGEIIVAMTGNSGDTLPEHVGLWVFEWDGVIGSNNYGIDGQPTERYIEFARDENGNLPDRYRAEDIVVGDFDDDSTQEVLWVNNASTAFDNAYLFSIVGDIGGLNFLDVEKVFKRADYGFGGSTNGAYGPMDLDGDGHPEGVIGVWNRGAFAIFESVEPDSYLLKYYVEGLDSSDLFPCNKLSAIYDYDNDGRDEFFYSGEYPGSYSPYFASGIYVVNVNGDDIDSNTVEIDTIPIDNSQYGLDGFSVGDIDGNGMFDVYLLFSINRAALYAEYQGGDITDPNNYEVEPILPEVFEYAETVVVDTDTVYYYFNPTLSIKPGYDLDGDGFNEVVYMVYEGRSNSNYPYRPWNTGFLRVAEYHPEGIEEWTVLPPKGSVPELNVAPTLISENTTIRFYLPSRMNASVNIYDVSGRMIKSLANGQFDAGQHVVRWDGTDANGNHVRSGVYVLRLQTPDGSASRRVVVAR